MQASHRQGESQNEGVIDREKSSVVFQRYYHLFDSGELDGLIEQTPGIRLIDSFFDKSNWCCIFEKLDC